VSTEKQALDSRNAYAVRVRALLEKDDVVHARALLREGLEHRPEDPELLELDAVLRPPRGKPRSFNDADRLPEFEWIAANRDSYRGQWVALDGGRLVAAASTLEELQSRLENRKGVSLVHRID
jgi:Family of unknown function (DUF5678)